MEIYDNEFRFLFFMDKIEINQNFIYLYFIYSNWTTEIEQNFRF